MANFRGQDGSFTIAGVAAGEIKSWSVSISQEVLDASKMGDTYKTVKGGMGSWTGQAQANLDYSNAQQKAILDALVGATGATLAAEFIVTSTGPKKITGNVLPTGAQISDTLGSIVSVTFDFTGSGAPAIAWT